MNLSYGRHGDCCGLVPFHCGGNGTCTARRNGRVKSVNERVTQAAVDAHVTGKNATLREAVALVTDPSGNNGTFFNKVHNKEFTEVAGNIVWIGDPAPPPGLHKKILAGVARGGYVVVGGSNSYANPKKETLPTGQNISDGRSLRKCSEDKLAQFLLGVEPVLGGLRRTSADSTTLPGAYLLCNGWDERFGRPLGLPLGPPAQTAAVWSRTFKSGVVAKWDESASKGTVVWPGVPAPPPTPPAPPPAPSLCPGLKCPPVPAANYGGVSREEAVIPNHAQ
eukprot:gene574-12296_t